MLAQQNRGAGTKPILEINLRHPLVAAIAKADKRRRRQPICRCCCWSRRRSSTANCRKIPAAFAGRLNRLVLRGLAR